jgi:hypothetical protein
MIDAYTIKSYVRQAFRQTPNIDYVMRTVYRWIIDHLGPDPDWTGIDNMILMEFEKCRKDQEQRKMLLEMNAATARGIITDLETEDKIKIPNGYSVTGRPKGKVVITYDSGQLTFIASLTNLRAKLLRQFLVTRKKK